MAFHPRSLSPGLRESRSHGNRRRRTHGELWTSPIDRAPPRAGRSLAAAAAGAVIRLPPSLECDIVCATHPVHLLYTEAEMERTSRGNSVVVVVDRNQYCAGDGWEVAIAALWTPGLKFRNLQFFWTREENEYRSWGNRANLGKKINFITFHHTENESND